MPETRVTMLDVAAASGVSTATVSFVLNKSPGQSISAATRARVEQAARDLGYVPNGIARALREGASRIVVLSISEHLEGHYSRTFIRGLDEELRQHDHLLLVQHRSATRESVKQLADAVGPRAVVEFAGRYLHGRELDDGGWQDGMASHTALQLRFLADRGHRALALALPPGPQPLGPVRLGFARKAAAELGCTLLPFRLPPGGRTEAAAALGALLAEQPRTTAVAGISDDVALRVLAAAGDRGLGVPDDLAVIGYDETDYGALASPALTTVRIDAEAHGRRAARHALGLDLADLTPASAQVVVRESV